MSRQAILGRFRGEKECRPLEWQMFLHHYLREDMESFERIG